MRDFVLATTAALAFPACGLLSPQTDTTRFAVLASVDDLPGGTAASTPGTNPPASLGVGPVTLPEYLRRSELVSRGEGTRIVLSEDERWAEPLDRAIERVLAIDLVRATGAGRVVHHPWYASDRPDVQVEIAFSRFEREESGNIVVAAAWSVRDLAGGAPPIARETRIERATEGSDGASTALALSRALAELCAEIAGARGASADEPR